MSIWLEPKSYQFEPPLSDFDPLVAGRLAHLGLVTQELANAFLNPELYIPGPTSELTGLMAVADRVESAILKNELICVWGDFDVDGQTSTTILVSMLQDLGAAVTFHIPIRGPESHGLNLPHLSEVIGRGVKLILTCDTGINANEPVDYCNARSVDVVITDHHDLPPQLPKAIAISNPKFLPIDHPFRTLSGAGVAFKLAEELYARFNQNDLIEKHLDLVALGLVADVTSLEGDARFLVQRGLVSLRNTTRLGLKTLMEVAELNPANLTEEHIGFVIAPRLNALGRLDDANIAVELFTTTNPTRAKILVTMLEGLNAQRQLLTSQVYAGAESQISLDPSILQKHLILLAHPSWPAGIIGIAASRLVDHYHRPVILISNPPNELARGSARSIEGINISAAIANHNDLLLNFGGHPMAAGLAIDPTNITEFREKLERTISNMTIDKTMESTIQLDKVFNLNDLNMELADTIELLAPFGSGNPKPILASYNLSIVNMLRIGRQKEHAKFIVEDTHGNQQQVLWWNAGTEVLPESRFDLAYNLRASDWKGLRQLQLEFIDLHISHEEQIPSNKSKIEIIDHRHTDDLKAIIHNLSSGSIIWVEGVDKNSKSPTILKNNSGVKIADRNNFVRSDCLVIWTIPASPNLLRTALEKVDPHKIILLNGSQTIMTPKMFMENLMGLVKYTLSHLEGNTSYAALAAATAQREITIQSGLECMVFEGIIEITMETGNELKIIVGESKKDSKMAARCWYDVQSLLKETNAFRSHFINADMNLLIP